jgi:hypothetical protein
VSIVSGFTAGGLLSIQRSANILTASTAAVVTLLYYTRRTQALLAICFHPGFLSCQYGVRAFVPFSLVFPFPVLGRLGQCVGVGGPGFYTMLRPHSHLFT